MAAGIEGTRGIDLGQIELIADEAAGAGLGSGGQRGRVDPGHGRHHRVARGEIHALRAETEERRGVLRRDAVGPQPVHHEHDDEALGTAHAWGDCDTRRPAWAPGSFDRSVARIPPSGGTRQRPGVSWWPW